jgi:hypothetical protein
MKRYRVLGYDFDSRAAILKTEIHDSWEPDVKEQWHNNKINIEEQLVAQYGAYGYHSKLKNFIDLGPAPWSVISFHNKFLKQVRESFVIGAYYPSLTSACSLGERILNQLIIHLRDFYESTPEYKKVHKKSSFDNWDLAIGTLESWGVILKEVAELFRELKDTRNKAIHFNPETDDNDRNLSLLAIEQLSKIIQRQFASIGSQPWYITGTKGATFIRKCHEETPFVKTIIIPNSAFVGPLHKLDYKHGKWIVYDGNEYPKEEISDEDFAVMFNDGKIR